MSSDISPEFVERYQLLLQKDPRSRLFAPLAEAYRKMGLIKEAEKLCERGVKIHPSFPGGRVTYAKILLATGRAEEAVDQLQQAADMAPENILAHRLLAETWVSLRKPKEALKAFKMVLFLNPNDETAIRHVKKLESLTADEYDDELFEMKPLKTIVRRLPEETRSSEEESKDVGKVQRILERAVSLADAYVVRADFDRAIATLDEAEERLGTHPELTKRKRLLLSRNSDLAVRYEEAQKLKPIVQDFRESKGQQIERLKILLRRINDRRVE